MFYIVIKKKGLLFNDSIIIEKVKGFEKYIAKLTLSQYIKLFKDVRLSAFTFKA